MSKQERRISVRTIRDIVFVLLLGILSWKLVQADLSVSFENVTTSDLLSILLALFAIGLSVAFYVKANEISNRFYDNMYKFTKDNSELLGRMEAGFSEQLRHLDQGYSGLRDRFDQLPLNVGKTKAKVEDEKEEVKKLKEERRQLLDELAARANLQQEEKDELFGRLQASEIKLNRAERQLRRFQHQLRDADEEMVDGVQLRAVKHTQRKVLDMLDVGSVYDATDDELFRAWGLIRDELPRIYVKDLQRGNVLDKEGQLTAKGAEFFRNLSAGHN